MNITTRTDEELAKMALITPDEYDFEIIEADERKSKSGNDMIALKLRIFTDETERVLFDYLLDSLPYKLKHFCYAVGLGDDYETGAISPAKMIGRSGKCLIGIQKDKTGAWPDRNVIKDYVVVEQKALQDLSLTSDDDFPL